MSIQIPILMYHHIQNHAASRSDVIISVKQFSQQMAWLAKHGYRTLTLRGLIQLCQANQKIEAKWIIITFDDAYSSVWSVAKPIMDKYGFRGVVFAVANSIGKQNTWDQKGPTQNLPCMNKQELAALYQAGWEIGSHGLSHQNATVLKPRALSQELGGSKKRLEKMLRVPIQIYGYPFGAENEQVHAAVQRSGYLGACAISPGTLSVTSNIFALRRVYIKPSDRLCDFKRKISRWYLTWRGMRGR
jgi:peptidoglycan/xylan/chitin deacetylase (PgdA/CDA1 family)